MRGGSSSFWFLRTRAFAVSFILTKARCLNPAVESGSTNQPARTIAFLVHMVLLTLWELVALFKFFAEHP